MGSLVGGAVIKNVSFYYYEICIYIYMSYGRNLVHGERTSQNRVGPYRFCSGGTPPHLSSKSFFGFLRVYMDVYLLLKVLSSGHVQVHGS